MKRYGNLTKSLCFRSVMLVRAEILLHDRYGNSVYWAVSKIISFGDSVYWAVSKIISFGNSVYWDENKIISFRNSVYWAVSKIISQRFIGWCGNGLLNCIQKMLIWNSVYNASAWYYIYNTSIIFFFCMIFSIFDNFLSKYQIFIALLGIYSLTDSRGYRVG